MGRLGYRPALDGLRGIAILGVLLFHLTGKTGGWLGVNMFFVLSGFLITTLLVEEHQHTGAVSLKSFYRRRIFRLAPALIVAVSTYAVISAIVYRTDPVPLGAAFRGSLFALGSFSNIALAWNIDGGVPVAISHTWSLGLEDQFYFVWPPILALLLMRSSRRVAAYVMGAAAILVFAHLLLLTAAGAPGPRLGFAPDTASYPLLLGCLAAFAANTRVVLRFQAARWARLFDVLAAATIVYCLRFGYPTAQRDLGPLLNLAFVLVIAALVLRIASGNAWVGWLESGPLVALGKISYGLYLWQVILLAEFESRIPPGFLVVAAVAVSILSYRFVEQPFRGRGRARSPRLAEPVAISA